MPGGRPRGASPKSEAAYAAYAAMGPLRSLSKLSALLAEQEAWREHPPARRMLEKWSARYHWQDRVKVYDSEREEERRLIREERIVETNNEQYGRARAAFDRALNHAEELLDAGRLGGQATVQLIKVLADLQRIAIGADRAETQTERPPNIQIIIEQDNTPSPVPAAFAPRVVEALPEPAGIVIDGDSNEEP